MQPPYATLLASIAGGTPSTGGLIATAGATCQFSADPAGLPGTFSYRWEILDYPRGYGLPTGWSVDSNGVYFSTALNPPVITLMDAAHWGKLMPRFTVNGGVSANPKVIPKSQLVDSSTAISVASPSGLKDLGFTENDQFSDAKLWTQDHKDNLRLIETFIGGGGGGGGLAVSGTPVTGYVVMWDGVGARWEPVSGFSITAFAPTVSLVECGQSVVNPAFTAAYNVTPTTATLTNNANGESKDVHATPTSFASSQTYVKSTPNQSVIWTLNAANGSLAAAPRTCTMTWAQKNFFGISSAPANTEAFIESLSSTLATTRAGSFSVTASGTNKIYYAIPTRYGAPTFSVGGFAGGFILRASAITVTNPQGFAETYDLYESTNAGLGATTVTAS